MKDHKRVKFVSYTGRYPNLCSGVLTLEVNGIKRTDFQLTSGGRVWFSNGYSESHIDKGYWSVDIPEDIEYLREEIEMVVNENVPHGCCGGCL